MLLYENKKSKPDLAMQKINSNFESNNLKFGTVGILADKTDIKRKAHKSIAKSM